ncbi:MAG: phage tail protein, partial [Sphingomonadaceae bacterium]
MATLVLTTVGTLVGGPIGGAVGALIGQQVDQRLLAPRRQGPRLGDLSVQVSRYGQPIPKLFGTMRVSGSVIWATELIEDKHKSGGGKGKPKTTNYSYSASFAVALSARPIRAVHRIWADGKLLRGAAGDWKSEVGAFRLYPGDEEQPLDPLIAAGEGTENIPAFRGIAYAVFEHLELADFANHIPSLSFEVEADDGDVALHDILAELSEGAIEGADSMALGGFAASGDSARGVIEAIGRSIDIRLQDDGSVLKLIDADADPITLGEDQLGGTPDGRKRARHETERMAAGALPDEVAVAYYEPARDYQTGLQRARRAGPGHRVEQIELSAAISADLAKSIAEQRLAGHWSGRVGRTVTMPWRMLDVRAGDQVIIPGQPGRWRVREAAVEKMAILLKLTGIAPQPGDPPPATPGRVTGSPDEPHGETVLHLLDIPSIEDGALTAPRLWIVAAGTSPGWRRAGLIASSDGGLSYDELGSTAAPAVMGVAIDVLGEASAGLFDEINSVEIELLHDGMSIEG